MNKWDKRFLNLAKEVASWSKDPSTQVGAVIADENHRIVSLGFNGFPQGVDDDGRLENRELKYEITVHAEANAVLFAGKVLDNCTCYIYPLPPCSRCAGILIQSGIKRVVAPVTDKEKWKKSGELSLKLFKEAGVDCYLVEKLDE